MSKKYGASVGYEYKGRVADSPVIHTSVSPGDDQTSLPLEVPEVVQVDADPDSISDAIPEPPVEQETSWKAKRKNKLPYGLKEEEQPKE